MVVWIEATFVSSVDSCNGSVPSRDVASNAVSFFLQVSRAKSAPEEGAGPDVSRFLRA
jgi:hypothetical protein